MAKTVMTLDSGGTNFVFSAISDEKEVVKPIVLSAKCSSLDEMLKMIVEGFNKIQNNLKVKPSAISFSFPGPAEYELGIIGDLQNLPLFRGGVALGPMLQDVFKIPVFINNDGDLFAYGEAKAGLLPYVNNELEKHKSPKRYKNLLGVTFGTGFGGGIVSNGEMFPGDNSAQAEINRFHDYYNVNYSSEESTTIRAIKRFYAENIGIDPQDCKLEPKDIYEVGIGKKDGDKNAAINAFKKFAKSAGNALANASSLTDSLVVLGGGVARAWPLFLEDLVNAMNYPYDLPYTNEKLTRMEVKVYNLEDKEGFKNFLKGKKQTIKVPYSNRTITYDSEKRIGVGVSKLGTEKAIALGAYYYAINHL